MWKTGEKKKYSEWKNSLHLWVLGKGRGMGREEQSTPVGTREGEGAEQGRTIYTCGY